MLGLRTDKPEAELYLAEQEEVVETIKWHAHRQLSDTLLERIDELLARKKLTKSNLNGIVVYKGPGSFTGLRIGIAVANAVAWSRGIKIVGTGGDRWLQEGIKELLASKGDSQALPDYGQDPHITKQRK